MVTILWSAGFDSTALVLKYIQAGISFDTISVGINNNPGQLKAEVRARKQIMDYFKEEHNKTWMHRHYDFPPIEDNPNHPFPYALIQPLLFSTILLCNGGGEFHFGYVRGDDIWHHKQSLLDLVAVYNRFTHEEYRQDGTVPISIKFPFEWDTKDDLLLHYQRHKNVMQFISTTQDGQSWLTGQCNKSIDTRALADKLRDMPTVYREVYDSKKEYDKKDELLKACLEKDSGPVQECVDVAAS